MNVYQNTSEAFIKLQPVPKTHLFMKKINRIQAIDRQIRKKWIKIKRDSQQKHLTLLQDQNVCQFNKETMKKQTNFSFSPSKDPGQINAAQNSLKRQKILSNHKRHEEIFYRRRQKNRSPKLSTNLDKLYLHSPVEYISIDSISSRKKLKSQPSINNLQNYKQKGLSLIEVTLYNKKLSSEKPEQRRPFSLSSKAKISIKLPFMLEKRNHYKSRQMEISMSQSQKQLMELSTRSDHSMREWASQRKELFQKLKGGRAYYIMKSPTKFSEVQDRFII